LAELRLYFKEKELQWKYFIGYTARGGKITSR
jgi:hypothetical protein